MADVTTPFGFPYPEPTDLVRDGATDIEALAEGVNDQFLAGFQFAGQRIYTSSGQFVKADPLGTGDIGLRAIRVTVVGGGAGGGGAAAAITGTSSSAGGGAGGGAAISFIDDISILSGSETVTRGAGGTGAAPGANAGASGASSSLGTLVVATGGAGGAGAGGLPDNRLGGAGGAGGQGTTGDVQLVGGGGGSGYIISAGESRGTFPGRGGSSIFAGELQEPVSPIGGNSATGLAAVGIGQGGSGATTVGGGSTAAGGGAGGNGIVIIDCFV